MKTIILAVVAMASSAVVFAQNNNTNSTPVQQTTPTINPDGNNTLTPNRMDNDRLKNNRNKDVPGTIQPTDPNTPLNNTNTNPTPGQPSNNNNTNNPPGTIQQGTVPNNGTIPNTTTPNQPGTTR